MGTDLLNPLVVGTGIAGSGRTSQLPDRPMFGFGRLLAFAVTSTVTMLYQPGTSIGFLRSDVALNRPVVGAMSVARTGLNLAEAFALAPTKLFQGAC